MSPLYQRNIFSQEYPSLKRDSNPQPCGWRPNTLIRTIIATGVAWMFPCDYESRILILHLGRLKFFKIINSKQEKLCAEILILSFQNWISKPLIFIQQSAEKKVCLILLNNFVGEVFFYLLVFLLLSSTDVVMKSTIAKLKIEATRNGVCFVHSFSAWLSLKEDLHIQKIYYTVKL